MKNIEYKTVNNTAVEDSIVKNPWGRGYLIKPNKKVMSVEDDGKVYRGALFNKIWNVAVDLEKNYDCDKSYQNHYWAIELPRKSEDIHALIAMLNILKETYECLSRQFGKDGNKGTWRNPNEETYRMVEGDYDPFNPFRWCRDGGRDRMLIDMTTNDDNIQYVYEWPLDERERADCTGRYYNGRNENYEDCQHYPGTYEDYRGLYCSFYYRLSYECVDALAYGLDYCRMRAWKRRVFNRAAYKKISGVFSIYPPSMFMPDKILMGNASKYLRENLCWNRIDG